MRAPFQILAIPFRREEGRLLYCVFHRSDYDQWQFIAGGGEDPETPEEAAGREIFEESGVVPAGLIRLKSLCCVPASCFPLRHTYGWPPDTYVIPEYAFGFECREEIRLSREHTECAWLAYEDARKRLKWDSNRTALYELNCRLRNTL